MAPVRWNIKPVDPETALLKPLLDRLQLRAVDLREQTNDLDLIFELVRIETIAGVILERLPELSCASLAEQIAFLDNVIYAIATRIGAHSSD